MTTKGQHEGLFWTVMELFSILIVVVLTQIYTWVKICRSVHLKEEDQVICIVN